MFDLNKPDLGCRISTSRMSDFNKSDVGFLQVGCRILTSRMSDFYKSDVGCRMSDFNKPDVGFLQVGCRMSDFLSRMSDGTYKLPYKSDCKL